MSPKRVTITYTLTEWETRVLASERFHIDRAIGRLTLEEYAVYYLRAALYRDFDSLGHEPDLMPASRPPVGVNVERAPLRRRRGR